MLFREFRFVSMTEQTESQKETLIKLNKSGNRKVFGK